MFLGRELAATGMGTSNFEISRQLRRLIVMGNPGESQKAQIIFNCYYS